VWTPEYKEGLDLVQEWVEEPGVRLELDATRSLIAELAGSEPDLPALVIGSHLHLRVVELGDPGPATRAPLVGA
jgi:hypothetical protein